jgi:hypothetical protein
MHEASRAVEAEGTVSKRTSSAYRPGRSRQWLKGEAQSGAKAAGGRVAAVHTGPARGPDPGRAR